MWTKMGLSCSKARPHGRFKTVVVLSETSQAMRIKHQRRPTLNISRTGAAALLMSTALCCAKDALAQSEGTLLVRLGATRAMPQVRSGDLTPAPIANIKVDIRAASQLSGGFTYMLTDRWALDLPWSLPFRHDIVGDGAIAGAGKIGSFKLLPPALIAAYRFLEPASVVRPWIGAGPRYVRLYDTDTTDALAGLVGPVSLKLDSKFAPMVQAGLSASIGSKHRIEVSVEKTFVRTSGTLSNGQSISVRVNPLAANLGVVAAF
jgi:outer membrane protein